MPSNFIPSADDDFELMDIACVVMSCGNHKYVDIIDTERFTSVSIDVSDLSQVITWLQKVVERHG